MKKFVISNPKKESVEILKKNYTPKPFKAKKIAGKTVEGTGDAGADTAAV